MLELRRLYKVFDYGTQYEKVVLPGLNLKVEQGEFVTIVGSNGAGKSTLLNTIAGTCLPDGGQIILDGQEITFWPEHRRALYIGRVFQNPLSGTAASMTVEENLAMALTRGKKRRLRRGVTPALRKLFREKLRALNLGLEERLQERVGQLSGGQRQALTLLMATISRPKLLLLDEHTAALDPRTAEVIIDLTVRTVARDGLTVLMVTHNLDQALHLGNRTLMMHEGEIVLDLKGAERRGLTVEDLRAEFRRRRDTGLEEDRVLLA